MCSSDMSPRCSKTSDVFTDTVAAMKDVSICVATFRRPEQLAHLLTSLQQLEAPLPGWNLANIVIIDNDANRTAHTCCASFDGHLPSKLIYAVEPEPGISQARNRAVELAGSRFVAFVDDDETVTPSWLNGLLATHEATGAPAVVGRVANKFEGSPPPWFDNAGLYIRARLPEASPMPGLSSSNLLLDVSIKETVGELFDPRFGLLGGSDRHLGLRMIRADLPIVHSAGSLVEELMPPERYSLRVLLRRWTRLGSTYVLTDLAVPAPTNDLERRVGHAFVSAGRLVVGATRATIAALSLNRGALLRSLEMTCRGVGGLSALVGSPVEGYPRNGEA